MREFHVLNLGAGVQSTTIELMARDPESPLCRMYGPDWKLDVSIFADTQDEPGDVYKHLDWLRSLAGHPILIRTRGCLGHDFLTISPGAGKTAPSIPVFTEREPGKVRRGRIKRQCTFSYKVEVVQRAIRRELVGLKPKQRMPRGVMVHQYFGISTDEARRAAKIRKRYAKAKWTTTHFPLLDLGWGRRGCQEWLKSRVPHEVPRSACVYCPFRNDHEWKRMKDERPDDWAKAVKFDNAIRSKKVATSRKLRSAMYLHRQCIPLDVIDFDNLPPQTLEPFTLYDCVGMCGV